MNYVQKTKPRFVRSDHGVLAGVCEGIAKQVNMDPVIVRLIWLLSVLVFGSGIILYLVLAWLLPRESNVEEYERPKFLGVCSRLGKNYGHEVALLRILLLTSFLFSGGLAFIFYLGIFIFVPENKQIQYYR